MPRGYQRLGQWRAGKQPKAAAVGVLRGCLWGQVGEEWRVLSSSVEKGAIWGHALWDQEK